MANPSNTIVDRYRRWFDYEKDSHARVLVSLETVPEAARATPAFARAVTLMAHIVEARRLWLFRFGIIKEGPTVDGFFPTGVTLPDLALRVQTPKSRIRTC